MAVQRDWGGAGYPKCSTRNQAEMAWAPLCFSSTLGVLDSIEKFWLFHLFLHSGTTKLISSLIPKYKLQTFLCPGLYNFRTGWEWGTELKKGQRGLGGTLCDEESSANFHYGTLGMQWHRTQSPFAVFSKSGLNCFGSRSWRALRDPRTPLTTPFQSRIFPVVSFWHWCPKFWKNKCFKNLNIWKPISDI